MPRKIKRQKRALSLEAKANWIMEKIAEHVRYNRAIAGHGAIGFTMRDIAKMTGYSASNKLMIDLYAMCDHGYLILEQESIKKTGATDVRNKFWTAESHAERLIQKKLFKEIA